MIDDFHYWQIRRIVPDRFKKSIGFDESQFRVIHPYPAVEIELIDDPRGPVFRVPRFFKGKSLKFESNTVTVIPLSMYCMIIVNDSRRHVFLPKDTFPVLFEALGLYAECFSTGGRANRYIALYKAYETITDKKSRVIELSAIRHSLTHSHQILSATTTLEALHRLFGGVQIDLNKRAHAKTFYIHFWKLLMITDNILFAMISGILPSKPNLMNKFYLANK